MITMNKRPELQDFSKIIHNPYEPDKYKACKPNYSSLGFAIYDVFRSFEEISPDIGLKQYVIMPDHIHFILQIFKELDMPLGKYLAIFKNRVINRAREKGIFCGSEGESVFEPGFNDQFLLANRSLNGMYVYLQHNPYWRWMRWERPEFFRRIHDVELVGIKCSLYGNLSLLDNAFKSPVIAHRAEMADPDLMKRKMDFWEYTILNGGVVVGAFVNKVEKGIRDFAFERGGKVIWIRNVAYEERQKPSEGILNECAKGNLLIVSPDLKGALGSGRTFREECLFMNDLAERMALG